MTLYYFAYLVVYTVLLRLHHSFFVLYDLLFGCQKMQMLLPKFLLMAINGLDFGEYHCESVTEKSGQNAHSTTPVYKFSLCNTEWCLGLINAVRLQTKLPQKYTQKKKIGTVLNTFTVETTFKAACQYGDGWYAFH